MLIGEKESDTHDFRYYDSVHSVLMFPRRIGSYRFVVTKSEWQNEADSLFFDSSNFLGPSLHVADYLCLFCLMYCQIHSYQQQF